MTILQINDWITNITTVYADKAKVIEVGKSFEGRPIRLIQVYFCILVLNQKESVRL